MRRSPALEAAVRDGEHVSRHSTRNKSLFASFSSEKEGSSFFEKKEAKNFCFLRRRTMKNLRQAG
jgi:hypothetical protein